MCYKITMKTKELFLITLIIFLFTGAWYVYSENMISNPSFEELTQEGNPVNWRTQSWTSSGNQFGVDKSSAHSGTHSVFINNDVPNHGYYIQGVSVKPNSFYKVSAWIKTENIAQGPEGAGISIINYLLKI